MWGQLRPRHIILAVVAFWALAVLAISFVWW